MRKYLALALVVTALAALLAAACTGETESGPAATTATQGPTGTMPGRVQVQLTQVNEAAGIAIEATWVTDERLAEMGGESLAAYPLNDYVLVHLAFTTHSGDLGQYDLSQLSSLRINGADAPVEAWVSLSDDPHHREGVLVFARPTATGSAELVLRDIGGEPQRVFRWEAVPEA